MIYNDIISLILLYLKSNDKSNLRLVCKNWNNIMGYDFKIRNPNYTFINKTTNQLRNNISIIEYDKINNPISDNINIFNNLHTLIFYHYPHVFPYIPTLRKLQIYFNAHKIIPYINGKNLTSVLLCGNMRLIKYLRKFKNVIDLDIHIYDKKNTICICDRLCKLTKLSNLSIKYYENLSGLDKLINLTSLKISRNKSVTNEIINKLTNLTSLNISRSQINSITELINLTSLNAKYIDLHIGNKITKLKKLTVRQSKTIYNFAKYKLLEELNASFLNKLNYANINNQNLKKLIIYIDNRNKDEKEIISLINLEKLEHIEIKGLYIDINSIKSNNIKHFEVQNLTDKYNIKHPDKIHILRYYNDMILNPIYEFINIRKLVIDNCDNYIKLGHLPYLTDLTCQLYVVIDNDMSILPNLKYITITHNNNDNSSNYYTGRILGLSSSDDKPTQSLDLIIFKNNRSLKSIDILTSLHTIIVHQLKFVNTIHGYAKDIIIHRNTCNELRYFSVNHDCNIICDSYYEENYDSGICSFWQTYKFI